MIPSERKAVGQTWWVVLDCEKNHFCSKRGEVSLAEGRREALILWGREHSGSGGQGSSEGVYDFLPLEGKKACKEKKNFRKGMSAADKNVKFALGVQKAISRRGRGDDLSNNGVGKPVRGKTRGGRKTSSAGREGERCPAAAKGERLRGLLTTGKGKAHNAAARLATRRA